MLHIKCFYNKLASSSSTRRERCNGGTIAAAAAGAVVHSFGTSVCLDYQMHGWKHARVVHVNAECSSAAPQDTHTQRAEEIAGMRGEIELPLACMMDSLLSKKHNALYCCLYFYY